MASKVAPSNEEGDDLDASCHTMPPCTGMRHHGGQDEDLRKIIEKQRIVIRGLHKTLAKVTADRDSLLARCDTNAAADDRPPAAAAAAPVQHDMLVTTDDDDALSTSPSSSSCCSTASSTNPAGPVPPPRSPYRQQQHYSQPHPPGEQHPPSPDAGSAKEQLTEEPVPHRLDILSRSEGAGRKNPNARSSSLPVANFKPSTSPTPTVIVNSPVSAILDKDAQLFARYQESLQRSGDDDPCSKAPAGGGDEQQQQWLSWPSPPPIPPTEKTASLSPSSSLEQRRLVRRASSQPAITSSTRKQQQQQKQHLEKHIDRLLDGVSVKVLASNITTNHKGKGVFSFTISVGQHADKELWCIEKLYSDLLALDTKLKSQCRSKIPKATKFPDKALFATHVPSKADQRKQAIEKYLQRVIEVPWPDLSVLHDFLNSNKIHRDDESQKAQPGYKTGYLTRRGKSFTGWKTRYFVLERSIMRYYDNPNGTLLGTIHIPDTQIRAYSSQPTTSLSSSSNEPHHAFLIIEPKKTASPGSGVIRHLLCAESDEERDEWVDALAQAKGEDVSFAQQHYYPPRANSADSAAHHEYLHHDERPPLRQRSSMDQAYMPTNKKYSIASSLGASTSRRGSLGCSSRACSPLPMDDQDSATTPGADAKKKKGNRRTFWSKKMATGIPSTNSIRGLLSRSSTDTSSESVAIHPSPTTKTASKVFSVPLEEAVRASSISESCHLPAIVVRCIEYLEANNATREEGIYRLSGSAVKIRSLQEQFDQGIDVNLLESDEHHDIHAVAGVLKMWLRELPENVLTQELLPDFLPVIDLVDRQERVQELGRLVSMLPLANYALLRSLCTHLIGIVSSSETNKMTARNVGIIFSPTLQIPTGIFSLFLSEFQYIFMANSDTVPADSNKIQLDPDISLSPPVDVPPSLLHPTQPIPRVHQQTILDEQGRSNRNSVHYMNGTPFSIVGLEKGNAIVGDDDEVDDLDLHNDGIDDDEHLRSSAGIEDLGASDNHHDNDNRPADFTSTPFTASGHLLAMK